LGESPAGFARLADGVATFLRVLPGEKQGVRATRLGPGRPGRGEDQDRLSSGRQGADQAGWRDVLQDELVKKR